MANDDKPKPAPEKPPPRPKTPNPVVEEQRSEDHGETKDTRSR